MQLYVGMQGKTHCIAFAGSSIRQISSAAGGSTNAASSCVSTTHPAGKWATYLNNTTLQQKATKAPKTQLDHAIQALSCVKKCQMGVSGQADGWSPKNSVIKGPFIRAKHMQAEVGSSTGVLDSKHLTNRQYNAYLDESWTFGTRPEHALVVGPEL